MKIKLRSIIPCLVLAVSVCACSGLGGDPREAEVKQAVKEVTRLINSARHNIMAGVACVFRPSCLRPENG